MSTLADELLQDFEDSGSEAGDDNLQDEANGLIDAPSAVANGGGADSMDIDGGESGDEDSDLNTGILGGEDETKAKVEKMELGGVDDVRSVASLMQTLEPVLQV
jgi:U4/U6 small nuclear ribonucleoprotein PRP31